MEAGGQDLNGGDVTLERALGKVALVHMAEGLA